MGRKAIGALEKMANILLGSIQKILAFLTVLEMNLLGLRWEVDAANLRPGKHPERSRAITLILKMHREGELLLPVNEAYQIYISVVRTEKVPGSLAEVGVFRGGSAKLICEAKGQRTLNLFDTFEGLPEVEGDDSHLFSQGEYRASFESVSKYLSRYPNVNIYKGYFPATSEPIKNDRFAFVHLDVDLHKSTHDCLEFFYPRMNRGGIIISHDYLYSPGVMKAFDDFFANKPETIIESPGLPGQALVVKM